MKGLKKLLGLTLAAMMTMSLVGCSSSGDNGESGEAADKLQQIKDSGVLKVGTSAEYSPYEFHKVVDGEDKIVGFDDFIVQEIAKDMGVKVEYTDMDFDGLLGALQADKVDIVLAGMTPNEERKKSVDFSEIYYTNSNVCIVAKGKEDSIKSSDDLKKLKVGVQKGTTTISSFIEGAYDLVIGARASSSGTETTSFYSKGNISDVRIYTTALSANDIKELYNTSLIIDNSGKIYTYEYVENS